MASVNKSNGRPCLNDHPYLGRWKELLHELKGKKGPLADRRRLLVIAKLYSAYLFGYSLQEIADAIEFSFAAVHKMFSRYPWIDIRQRSIVEGSASCMGETAPLNKTTFSEIDSEEKAYWLGLLWADGYVIKHYKRLEGVRLEVHINDREIVEKFVQFLGGHSAIRNVLVQGKHYHARVNVYCVRLAADLAALGLTSKRSSRNVDVPKLQACYFRHFMRGLFDGDGCITRDARAKFPLSGWYVSLAGSPAVMQAWTRLAIEVGDFSPVSVVQNGSNEKNRQSFISGPRGLKVLQFLYRPDEIALSSHRRLVSVLLNTYTRWLSFGLSTVRRGDGWRFVNTNAISQRECLAFVGRLTDLDYRAEVHWGFASWRWG